MKKIISNDKIKHIIISSWIGIFIGIFLPVIVSAQEAYDRVVEQGREDCQKIAAQLGKEAPINLDIGGTGIDTYSVGCSFSNDGFPGFAFLQVEDMRIAINIIGFSRSTPEAAQNFRIKRNASEDTKETTKDGFEKIHRKTPDGSEYIYKGYLLFTWQEFRKTHTAEVSIVRGTCTVSVTGRSAYGGAGYHISDPKTHEDINKHPGFNHDREEDILKLARQKAEEIFSVLNCGEGTPLTTLPGEDLPEVEALVEKTPTNEDLPMPSKTEEDPENWGEAIVTRMTGGADMQLADGSWQTVEVGTKIPFGAKLFSSYASEVTLEFPNNLVIVVLALSELDIDNPTDYIKKAPRLKLGTGDVRFKATQGDFRTDMRVDTPNSTASPTGTDFRVSYDKETGRTIWEIYDHSITVTSNSTGETKTISSSYGSPIRRIEVSKDGVMTEQIAIPKDEWQARQGVDTQNQPQESKGNGLFWVFLLILLGGGMFTLHKKGKLQPIFQKVSGLVRKKDPMVP